MERYKIEKGVEIPDSGNKGRRSAYPFKDMKVGDSFCVSREVRDGTLRSAIHYAQLTLGRRFSTRRREEKGVKVYRIWRTK